MLSPWWISESKLSQEAPPHNWLPMAEHIKCELAVILPISTLTDPSKWYRITYILQQQQQQ